MFDGAEHVPVATLPGMAGRTLTICSAGKTFSLTGWKIGWVTGPAELVTAVRTVKQFLTYVSGAPFQPAVAAALGDDDVARRVRDLADSLAHRRDLLCGGLERAGFRVVRPQGTYFVVADGADLGFAGRRRPVPPAAGAGRRRGGAGERVHAAGLGGRRRAAVGRAVHLREAGAGAARGRRAARRGCGAEPGPGRDRPAPAAAGQPPGVRSASRPCGRRASRAPARAGPSRPPPP